MQNQNARYAQWWTIFNRMPTEYRAKMWPQLMSKIQTVTMVGVIEALEDAPESAKVEVWKRWAESHDLSGYVLKQIEALKESEPASAVDHLMREWQKQCNLSSCDVSDVFKMALKFSTLEDVDRLWTRWAKQTDLRRFEIETFCKVTTKVAPSICEKLVTEWIKQNGDRAVYSVHPDKMTKIRNLGLPIGARNKLNEALLRDPNRC